MIDQGAQAEKLAVQYLQRNGLKLVEQNYRGRFGEIDLIMQDGTTLVFVEVRLRRNGEFGGAAASIDMRKQQRIVSTAQQYLASLARIPECRFDVVLMDEIEQRNMHWLKNAFDA